MFHSPNRSFTCPIQNRFPQENAQLSFPEVFGINYLKEGHLFEAGLFPEAWARWFELFISTRDSPGFPFLHQDMCSTHALSMQVQNAIYVYVLMFAYLRTSCTHTYLHYMYTIMRTHAHTHARIYSHTALK